MSGHIHLRYDRDKSLRSIGHDIFVLILRIKTSRSTTHLSTSTDLSQLGPRLDLNPPTLIIGQMEMKMVQLVGCYLVDIVFHILNGDKMPRDIEHRCSISVSRFIFYGTSWKRPSGRLSRRVSDFFRENLQ